MGSFCDIYVFSPRKKLLKKQNSPKKKNKTKRGEKKYQRFIYPVNHLTRVLRDEAKMSKEQNVFFDGCWV